MINRLEVHSLVVMGNYDICKLRFPDPREYELQMYTTLQRLAFAPVINDLFLVGTLETDVNSLDSHDYLIVAPARLLLYCCTGVRMLTGSLFNGFSYDVLVHAYFKRHHHIHFTAEAFSLASTLVSDPMQFPQRNFHLYYDFPVLISASCSAYWYPRWTGYSHNRSRVLYQRCQRRILSNFLVRLVGQCHHAQGIWKVGRRSAWN